MDRIQGSSTPHFDSKTVVRSLKQGEQKRSCNDACLHRGSQTMGRSEGKNGSNFRRRFCFLFTSTPAGMVTALLKSQTGSTAQLAPRHQRNKFLENKNGPEVIDIGSRRPCYDAITECLKEAMCIVILKLTARIDAPRFSPG